MEEGEVSTEAAAERDAIIAEIHVAFATATRGKPAISWSETRAMDNYEDEEGQDAARKLDTESHWSELVDDKRWQPFPGIGGFSFINAEGFRYYLPPTMIRCLRGDNSEWYPGHLLGCIERFAGQSAAQRFVAGPTGEIQVVPDKSRPVVWSTAQLVCIARFIAWMARHDPSLEMNASIGYENVWAGALERTWKHLLVGA